jgi:hypothetical protein
LLSSMGVWTYIRAQVLDDVHLGCHGNKQRVSQQEREAGMSNTC